jgi:hypothetical protein
MKTACVSRSLRASRLLVARVTLLDSNERKRIELNRIIAPFQK